ncbi:hypothetical protein MLD38_031090 [Melastoma candidum]|uniref:Uncharacterized protein n=1 Tax=Melastoma candidum TaxID=119954 RepID=A0ACB9MNN9_9MYRT|nr:hypothetical protein MLD38_031090 [Melastoma candidum]
MDSPRAFNLPFIFIFIFLSITTLNARTFMEEWGGPFDYSYYRFMQVFGSANIAKEALQVTHYSVGSSDIVKPYYNQSGRVLYNSSFKLWDLPSARVASFSTSFLINIFQLSGTTSHGEGLAFIISPDLNLPSGSSGGYLGLTNATTDGNATNQLIAVEFDTYKQDFDPDDNHVAIDINSVRSVNSSSLSDLGFQLVASNSTLYYHVWIDYDGIRKILRVYLTNDSQVPIKPRPADPILTYNLDISKLVAQRSYFGFSASTGTSIELNCVLRWNLTVEILPDGKGLGIGLMVALCVGGAILAALLIGSFILVCRRRRKRAAESGEARLAGTLKNLPGNPREFSFKDLKRATDDFNEKNKLGHGGFGVVYRGVLPEEERTEIAVKRFSRDDMKCKDDFLAELVIINQLRHKHLVRLYGWCHENGSLLLVYEYMPNGSLDKHIFSGPEEATLAWPIRYNVISGVAYALHYLHTEFDQKVVNRDLKASNILLDSEFNARLGDFGLARAIDNEKTSYTELNGVPGTMGYIAPECLHTGKASRESDIYGFGAVILEVVCGRRPWSSINGYHMLVDWVWSLYRDGRILDAVDERLGHDYVREEAERLLLLGLACSHSMADQRPKTNTIVQILIGSVPVPRVPAFRPAFVYPLSEPVQGGGGSEMMNDVSFSDSGYGYGYGLVGITSSTAHSDG